MQPWKLSICVVMIALTGWATGIGVAGWVASAATCDVEAPWNGGPADEVKVDHTDLVNQWWAGNGDDYLRGNACDDIDIHGQDGNDDVGGGSGDDNVYGETAGDDVYGGAHDDTTDGGGGSDNMFDAETSDSDDGFGGPGDDLIDFRDGDGWDDLDGEGGTADNCRSNTGDTESYCEI